MVKLNTTIYKEVTGRLVCICIEHTISGMMPTRYTNCMLSFVLCCLVIVQVAKAQGGSNAANQVAYLWAKHLGTII